MVAEEERAKRGGEEEVDKRRREGGEEMEGHCGLLSQGNARERLALSVFSARSGALHILEVDAVGSMWCSVQDGSCMCLGQSQYLILEHQNIPCRR